MPDYSSFTLRQLVEERKAIERIIKRETRTLAELEARIEKKKAELKSKAIPYVTQEVTT